MKRMIICLWLLCTLFSAVVGAQIPEVMLTNPNEPEADLGEAEDDSSDSSKAVAPATEKKQMMKTDMGGGAYVLENLKWQFVPFMGGHGSFSQRDTAGGIALLSGQLVTLGFMSAAVYHGVLAGMDTYACSFFPSSENAYDEYEAKMIGHLKTSETNMRIFGGIALGCFVAQNIFAIVRPLYFAKKGRTACSNSLHDSIGEAKPNCPCAVEVSFASVITLDEYGAFAVVRY